MKVIPQSVSFSITAPTLILDTFRGAIQKVTSRQKSTLLSGQIYHDMVSAFNEGVANVLRHTDEMQSRKKIDCQIRLTERQFEIRIIDHGKGFKMDKVPPPRFKSLKESGRGLFMMRQLMDSVVYKKNQKKNTLILKRFLLGSDRQSRDLNLLYEISDAILQSEDPDSVYRIILDKAVEAFGVERASILRYDPVSKKLTVVASRGLTREVSENIRVKPGEGISGYVFQHSKPCLIENMSRNTSGWKRKKGYKSQSFISAPMICSPLRLGQESMGVINMTDRIDGRPFTKRDLKLLTTIANQATAYLHICQLLSQAKDVEMMRRELEIARKIQQNYLPSGPPDFKGLKVSGWLETAESVGGDYYDTICQDVEDLYIVIADVSGHNIAAAMTMANFRSQLRALLFREKSPGQILTLMNKILLEDLMKNDQFISMILVRFNPVHRTFEWANAGHRPPLLIRDSKIKTPLSFGESGSVLGVVKAEIYGTQSMTVTSGDLILLYTDGVTEMMNPGGERFGFDRLCRLVSHHPKMDPSEFLKILKETLTHFRGGVRLSDDATAVSVKIL